MSMQEYREFLKEEERQRERNRAFDGLILKRIAERTEEEALAALFSIDLKSGRAFALELA
ncbi:MAG: hypothetical protein IJY62_02315 [Clostridia bacterium]|nr:hypothetical protein [Clostridia bacterium]